MSHIYALLFSGQFLKSQNLSVFLFEVDALPGPEGDEEKRDFLPLSGSSEKPICKEDVTRLF